MFDWKSINGAAFVSLLICSSLARAEPVAFIDESEFLAALTDLGHTAIHEGFENDATWGDVRSSVTGGFVTTATVNSLGITWSANYLSGGITTGSGPARSGSWGFYAYPHGSFLDPDPSSDCMIPGDCGDGFRGRVNDTLLYAIGGWIDTNTPFAKLGLFLGQYPENPVDFGETCDPPGSEQCTANSTIGTIPEFFGVIDEAGFERFEFRELEGKLEPDGGDIKYIFADDFTFALGHPETIFHSGFEPGGR